MALIVSLVKDQHNHLIPGRCGMPTIVFVHPGTNDIDTGLVKTACFVLTRIPSLRTTRQNQMTTTRTTRIWSGLLETQQQQQLQGINEVPVPEDQEKQQH